MPNVPPWPALMVSRGITKRTKLTVESTVGTVTDHPANVHGLYSTLGIDAGAPLNSLATYDDLGNLLPFEVEQFDGTNIVVHWKDSFASADANRYLYWDPTVDPGSDLATPTEPWTNGFAAVYHMGDAGPTNVLDSLGVNNGTQSGGVTFGATGQIGKGLSFDGTDDYVNCGADSSLSFEINTPFSIGAWVKTSDANGCILGKFLTGNIGYYMGSGSPGNLQCWIRNGNAYLARISSTVISDGTWHHVAMTYDGSNTIGGLLLYVDGSPEVGTTQANGTIATIQSAASLLIGQHHAMNFALAATVDEAWAASVARAAAWPLAENLFGLGTAVTVGAVETYQPLGGLPLILGRAGRSGPSLAGLRC